MDYCYGGECSDDRCYCEEEIFGKSVIIELYEHELLYLSRLLKRNVEVENQKVLQKKLYSYWKSWKNINKIKI